MAQTEKKSYSMPLAQRFEVTFKKAFGKFKSGDKTKVTLPIAMKWISLGFVDETTAISSAIEKAEAKSVVEEKAEEKKKKEKTNE